ncbi:MAG: hypothetical protein JSU70_02495 [Phycisphaerales bacterium]|nr:MAG: hypothetical protein JSU70_02495 [Phycisphaerales bacterium]
MNYQFDTELISQHIIKYGVDIRPPIGLKQENAKLQDYCNWLIAQFPEVFETLLAGPNQLRVHRSFILSDGKRAELPTFVLTNRGVVFTFPQRLFIDQPHEIDIPGRDKIFRKAVEELRARFAGHKVPRIGIVNEFVFDTGEMDSLAVVASNLKNDLWRERARNLRILLEAPTEDKNINLQINPTSLRRTGKGTNVPEEVTKFGIIVVADINNRQVSNDLTKAEINDLLVFADDYIPDELIRFLNNEY